jgi:hypothetical protein
MLGEALWDIRAATSTLVTWGESALLIFSRMVESIEPSD